MRIALVVNSEDFVESFGKGKMKDCSIVDFDDDKIPNEIMISLEDMNGDCEHLMVGLAISNDSITAMDLFNDYSKVLPIKTGDVILLFNVIANECLFADWELFNNLAYFNTGCLEDLIKYKGEDLNYCFVADLLFKDFHNGYLVADDWSVGSLTSGSQGELFEMVRQNSVNSTNVWRNF